jgi:uncharacterized damage-inducible protein DinB
MIDQQQLVEAFERNVKIINMQAARLTHQDSLLQPPFRGNCLNWVLGHILVHRELILQALGTEPSLGDAMTGRYGYDSAPLCEDGPDVIKLEELLEAIQLSQERIAAALLGASASKLAEEMRRGERTTTVAGRVFHLYFHETYHTGQTELLRQLAGTDDHVI